jgi:hypothetical protein
MSAVAVRHLRLVAPSEARVGAVQRIEEGLRLAAPAGRRVLLIRRLALGSLTLHGPGRLWSERIENRLRAIVAAAVYGLSPGAGRAAAVWFNSMEEMLAALLGLIGRGEQPSAWFWRAGVPACDGTCSPASAAMVLGTLGRTQTGSVAAARRVLQLAANGHLALIMAAIDSTVRRRLPPVADPGAMQPGARAPDVDRAVRLLARLPPATRAGLETALRGPAAEPLRAQWLVESALVMAAPELAATPTLLARTAAAWRGHRAATPSHPISDVIARKPPAAAATAVTRLGRQSPVRAPASPSPAGQAEVNSALPVVATPAPRRNGSADRDVPAPPNAIELPSLAERASREQASAAAGVLLLVGPLLRVGFAAWLAARPALMAEGFGRVLLCEMAARHRAPADDPVLALARDAPPAFWDDALTAWRIGLDRWLRRRARIRLSEVVGKRGWLTIADDNIDARFAPEAADIRLRRLALDVDPGWVPWLGLTLHYHYRGEPLA